jgi:hypothetical protein
VRSKEYTYRIYFKKVMLILNFFKNLIKGSYDNHLRCIDQKHTCSFLGQRFFLILSLDYLIFLVGYTSLYILQEYSIPLQPETYCHVGLPAIYKNYLYLFTFYHNHYIRVGAQYIFLS